MSAPPMRAPTLTMNAARYAGALALLVAFALGFGSAWLVRREPAAGMRLTVTATEELPVELERLTLTATQRTQAQEVIRRGRDRVLRVVDAFDPAMQAAVDSTDAELRSLLTESQRAAFDSARKLNGPRLQRKRFVTPQ